MYIKYWYYSPLLTFVLLWRYSSTHSLPSTLCAVSDQNHAWTDIIGGGRSGYKLDRSRSGRGALWERCHFIPGIKPRFSGCPARRLIIIHTAVSSSSFLYAIVRIWRHVKFDCFVARLNGVRYMNPQWVGRHYKYTIRGVSLYHCVGLHEIWLRERILTFTCKLLPLIYWEYKLKVYKYRKLRLLHKV